MSSKKPDPNWDYDEISDILYISFGEPVPAYGEHLDDDIVLRYTPDDELVGITVIGFKEMGGVDELLQRLNSLVDGLQIPLIRSHAAELRETQRAPVSK
jgi:uncharacterized protein YuzE